jgi:hypothetical protein
MEVSGKLPPIKMVRPGNSFPAGHSPGTQHMAMKLIDRSESQREATTGGTIASGHDNSLNHAI